jgi:tetratricopeptide (TPR) repeat protein
MAHMNLTFIMLVFLLFGRVHPALAEVDDKIKVDLTETLKNQQSLENLPDLILNEMARRDRYRENFQKESTEKKNKNVIKAEKYYKKGRKIFDEGDPKIAQRYYEKATSLNPYVDLYSYAKAVSLYRQEYYVSSLAMIDLVRGTSINEAELTYYEALNYMKLEENNTALKLFGYVVDDNDPSLSPSAAMYSGLLLKEDKKFQEAKDKFQYVLDTTKDAGMDTRAELQIEEIIAIERFQEESKKNFSFSAYTGMMYDSNVLNIADNNSSLDLKSYRLMYGGSVDYKAIYTPKHTLIPRFAISDIYSLDTSFGSDTTLQSADPLNAELSTPYSYNFTWNNKAAALTLVPAYSQIYMSLDENSRDLIYSSASLGTQLSTSHFEKWMNTYRFDFSSDTFHPATTPENDQSALKFGLNLSTTRFFDNTGYKTLSFLLAYTLNDATGINSKYDRYMLSVAGTYPLAEKMLAYSKLDYTAQDFSKSVTNRSDTGFIVTAGSSYELKTNLSLNFSAQYNDNSSNVELYDYNKFVFMTMISYNSGFF